jgi:hypothetical protein
MSQPKRAALFVAGVVAAMVIEAIVILIWTGTL